MNKKLAEMDLKTVIDAIATDTTSKNFNCLTKGKRQPKTNARCALPTAQLYLRLPEVGRYDFSAPQCSFVLSHARRTLIVV